MVTTTYPLSFPGPLRRLAGTRPEWFAVRLHDGDLDARFGPWRVRTPLTNVVGAEPSGPYRFWKVLGPRLSLVDRGLTFGTSTVAGVCIRFAEPVPGLEPTGRLRHPALTVTVAEPHALVEALSREIARTGEPPQT